MKNVKKIIVVDDEKYYGGDFKDFDLVFIKNTKTYFLDICKRFVNLSAIIIDVNVDFEERVNFIKEIRNDNLLNKMPLFVTTDKELGDEEIELLDLGVIDVIKKPFSKVVSKKINNVIDVSENEIEKLIGINNTSSLYKYIHYVISGNQHKKYSIIMVDIYKFRVINDIYGPEKADEILVKLASEIERVNKKYNGICGHSYADQFIMAVSEYDESFEKELKEIEANINKSLDKIRISLKAGVYDVEDPNMPVITMCARAKFALNEIKDRFDIRVAKYDEALKAAISKENKILSDMKMGINEGQFKVYYQPKYDVLCEKTVGAEALVRWVHPEYGMISPADFIPIFEKNGFITEVDLCVWEECCKFLQKRKNEGKEIIPISVNVSRLDMVADGLVDKVCELVDRYGIEHKYFHLEITETAYANDPEKLNRVLEEFKSRGFVIEIDDFGSGHSSLSILSEMPTDILKLDMKFLNSKQDVHIRNKILYSVVKLANLMNLKIVAEGVETKEQLDYLRKIKCNYVQGYYFSKPLPEEDFEEIIDNENNVLHE